MISSKSLFILAITAAAFATSNAIDRRQLGGDVTCDYVVRPSGPVDGVDLTTEFNYAIGRTIAIESPSQDTLPVDRNATAVDNGDGTFTVNAQSATSGLTSDELKGLVTSWVGRALIGFSQTFWVVDSVACE
ncbi:hypothetical protein V5O48_007588 [Marasmius crinis-equi]|uniref:Uncharacterized protein n=1 Tax=Marasmius crinis-equi TaxID=585013 RepID=A0ABR3FGQ4_9AGAR